MNGPEILEHAAGLVTRRRREYGEPVNLFEHVAHRWPLTLGTKVSPAHVVLCLIDLKLARRVGNLPRLAAMAREQAKREQWRCCRTIHELRTRLRRLQIRPIHSSAEAGGGSRRYGILVVPGHPTRPGPALFQRDEPGHG